MKLTVASSSTSGDCPARLTPDRESVIAPMAGDGRSRTLTVAPNKGDLLSQPNETTFKAEAHDLIVIGGHRVGEPERVGEILAVLGKPGHEHYRVLWEDGHESVFYPSNDAVIRHSTGRATRR
jgi:hypothetical protein